jgi:hypothetical protein
MQVGSGGAKTAQKRSGRIAGGAAGTVYIFGLGGTVSRPLARPIEGVSRPWYLSRRDMPPMASRAAMMNCAAS